jgi:hypothetical protein
MDELGPMMPSRPYPEVARRAEVVCAVCGVATCREQTVQCTDGHTACAECLPNVVRTWTDTDLADLAGCSSSTLCHPGTPQ